MNIRDYTIGIDLGTESTRTAVYRNGKTEIVLHDDYASMPSYVAFTQHCRLVGMAAKRQAGLNPANTIFNALLFIGKRFLDIEVQDMIKTVPFKVINVDGEPAFEVDYQETQLILNPTEILTMVLSQARRDTQKHLETPFQVHGAVISIPACFNFRQRQAVRDAAAVAELGLIRITSTAITTCMDHVFRMQPRAVGKILIIDLGAGFFEVAVIDIAHTDTGTTDEIASMVQIKASDGDSQLAGGSCNDKIISLLLSKASLAPCLSTYIHDRTPRITHRLRTACEKAKRDLSTLDRSHIKIEHLDKGETLEHTLTQDDLHRSCSEISTRLDKMISSTISAAKLGSRDIDTVILTGGSSRMPFLQHVVRKYFEEFRLQTGASRHPAVEGAAIFAAIILGHAASEPNHKILVLDTVPASISIDTGRNQMQSIFKKGDVLPTTSKLVINTEDRFEWQGKIYEGEDATFEENTLLGTLRLPFQRFRPDISVIELRLEYSTDGDVIAHFYDRTDNQRSTERLSRLFGLPEHILSQMKRADQKFDVEEQEETARKYCKTAFELYICFVLEQTAIPPCTETTREAARRAKQALDWLDEHPTAPETEFTLRLQELESHCKANLLRLDSEDMASAGSMSSAAQQERHNTQPVGNLQASVGAGNTDNRSSISAGDRLWASHGDVDWSGTGDRVNTATERRFQAFVESDTEDNEEKSSISSDILDTNANTSKYTKQEGFRSLQSENNSQKKLHTISIDPTPESYGTHVAEDLEALAESIAQEPATDADENASSQPDSPVSPITPQLQNSGMQELFWNSRSVETRYTDEEFLQIAALLKVTGRPSWSAVPRLYTILRIVKQLDYLDTFIDQGITDIFLPFTDSSLPTTLSPSLRVRILERQELVLSKSLMFENNADRRHGHFLASESLPFKVIGKLGSGVQGQVDKVVSTISLREYARKRFKRPRGTSKDAIKSFLVELQVLKRIQHRHCIELMHSYTDPKHFTLLMSPVAEFNMQEYYHAASDSPDKITLLRSFFGCLAGALHYIHIKMIRHRDIKPQNILVKGDKVYLTDFGIALDWAELERSTTTADSGKTPVYAAPEVMQFHKRNSAADVWSLGCVFMEMITIIKGESIASMRSFFEAETNNHRFYANIVHLGKWVKRLRSMGAEKDNAVFGWLKDMLHKDSDERPTAAELFDGIVMESRQRQVPFCGSCCVEDLDSSSVDDEDGEDDELWKEAADLTIVPQSVQGEGVSR